MNDYFTTILVRVSVVCLIFIGTFLLQSEWEDNQGEGEETILEDIEKFVSQQKASFFGLSMEFSMFIFQLFWLSNNKLSLKFLQNIIHICIETNVNWVFGNYAF